MTCCNYCKYASWLLVSEMMIVSIVGCLVSTTTHEESNDDITLLIVVSVLLLRMPPPLPPALLLLPHFSTPFLLFVVMI